MWLGFAATCQQAKQEAEEEGVRQQWQFVQDLQEIYQKTGYSLQLPRQITTAADFHGLKELTLVTDTSLDWDLFENTHFGGLVHIAVENLRIHFTSSALPAYPRRLVRKSLNAVEKLVDSDHRRHDSCFTATNLSISWDY
jgi:hypothetical protein